uniref:Uncharacterized protein n=1 Tax=Arundo donax TaxID=35708 RepID=A0A0A9AYK9_ARUDO
MFPPSWHCNAARLWHLHNRFGALTLSFAWKID